MYVIHHIIMNISHLCKEVGDLFLHWHVFNTDFSKIGRAFHDTCQQLRMSFFWREQFQLLNVLLSFIQCYPSLIGTCSLWFIIWVWFTVFIVNKNVLEGLFPVDQVVVVGLYLLVDDVLKTASVDRLSTC